MPVNQGFFEIINHFNHKNTTNLSIYVVTYGYAEDAGGGQ